jgi:ferric-dicitrate binding protein FerR (iron transport regulator)
MNRYNIQQYLEGKTTTEESQKIIEWLKDTQNEKEAREILAELWANTTIELKTEAPDFEKMLNAVHHRINQSAKEKREKVSHQFYSYFSRIAAILILPLLLATIYFYFNPRQETANTIIAMREVFTKPGTRTTIDLPDGTKVWLNDGTLLRYPEKFNKEKREVYLDGEAFFSVKADDKHPFVVNNPMMTTMVTGTQFNLNAYIADNYFEATLNEGKVALTRGAQNLTLKPGDQMQFDAKNLTIQQKCVNPENASAWINGKLIFKNEKMGTAIKKLGRWYNIQIEVTDPAVNNYLLTGTFETEKLEQTLKLIAMAVPVKFEFGKFDEKKEIERIIYVKKK